MHIATRLMVLCLAVLALPALAQSGSSPSALTEWHSDALHLRFSYPSDLTQADTAQVEQNGHLALTGITSEAVPAVAAMARCLRPDLLAQSATATIVLAELEVSCLTDQQQAQAKDLLGTMAEIGNKVPGMTPIAPPAWYNVGWQKVHMAAAQGSPESAAASSDAAPQRLYTMGFSTGWNNHLLVWFFTSTDIQTLNRITKSTVRFGRSAAAPLYSISINDAGPKQ